MATVTQIRRVFNPRRSRNPVPMLIELGALNPRKEKEMAKRKYRKSHSRVHRSRARASHRRTASNPHHRRRSRNVMMRSHRRRRSHNPMGGKVIAMGGGILAGIAATKVVTSLIPSSVASALPTQFAPLILTAAGAAITGFAAHKFMPGEFGNFIAAGAVAAVGYVLLDALVPSLSSYAQFGVSGIGAIIGGRYVVPQNPIRDGQQIMLPPPATPAASGMGHHAGFRPAF